ncbi:MAG: hypothetical protein JXR36_04465 [Bacteroidales bacterium]|nr:hypothetical protein [Bacteroidales bacterium]
MKTFYSILSAVINPISGEKISIGLLLSNGNESIFRCSDNRMAIVSKILNSDSRTFIKNYIKSIESVIKRIDINDDSSNIFYNEGKNVIVNEPYIEYLSRYSKNVISFSKPTSIDVDVVGSVYDSLFAKFIAEEIAIEKTIEKVIISTKRNFFPKAEKYFSIEKEFEANKQTKLLLPSKIDLFGKNGEIVMGQFFDLEKSANSIKSDFFDYNQIAKIHKHSTKFFVSYEPEKVNFPQQHYFWSEIRKQKGYTYVDISETDSIIEFANKNNVIPV